MGACGSSLTPEEREAAMRNKLLEQSMKADQTKELEKVRAVFAYALLGTGDSLGASKPLLSLIRTRPLDWRYLIPLLLTSSTPLFATHRPATCALAGEAAAPGRGRVGQVHHLQADARPLRH